MNARNDLPHLPPKMDIETTSILRRAISANIELARLKGYCSTIPNDRMLVNAIVLKEAQASSEIENIITTQDRLYQALVPNFRMNLYYVDTGSGNSKASKISFCLRVSSDTIGIFSSISMTESFFSS